MSKRDERWEVLPEESDKLYIRVRGTILGGRHKIANVLTPCDDERELNETRANARLIAAAPEMLDLLVQCRAVLVTTIHEIKDEVGIRVIDNKLRKLDDLINRVKE